MLFEYLLCFFAGKIQHAFHVGPLKNLVLPSVGYFRHPVLIVQMVLCVPFAQKTLWAVRRFFYYFHAPPDSLGRKVDPAQDTFYVSVKLVIHDYPFERGCENTVYGAGRVIIQVAAR